MIRSRYAKQADLKTSAVSRLTFRGKRDRRPVRAVLDDFTVLVESHGGDTALGQERPVIRPRQFLFNGRCELSIKHSALFDAEFVQFDAGREGEVTHVRRRHPADPERLPGSEG